MWYTHQCSCVFVFRTFPILKTCFSIFSKNELIETRDPKIPTRKISSNSNNTSVQVVSRATYPRKLFFIDDDKRTLKTSLYCWNLHMNAVDWDLAISITG